MGETGWIENLPGKRLRLTIPGKGENLLGMSAEDGIFVVAVYGHEGEGARFKVWAVANGQDQLEAEPLRNTTKYIIAYESIIQNDDEQLENYFQLIHKNAFKAATKHLEAIEPWYQTVDKEIGAQLSAGGVQSSLYKPSVASTTSNKEQSPSSLAKEEEDDKDNDLRVKKNASVLLRELEEEEDEDGMEDFILKTGSKLTLHEISNHTSHRRPDPNMDSRFYTSPNIISREEMLDDLDPAMYHNSLQVIRTNPNSNS